MRFPLALLLLCAVPTSSWAAEGEAAPSQAELLRRLEGTPGLEGQDKPFEIALSLGRLYLSQAQYRKASVYLAQALEKAEPARQFYLQKRKAAGAAALPAAESLGCAKGTLDEKLALARKQKSAAAAAACARAAIAELGQAQLQLGHARFLARDLVGALNAYELALATEPTNLDARYARGALLLDSRGDDVGLLRQARDDLKLVAEAPAAARSLEARALLPRAEAAVAKGGTAALLAEAPPPPPAAPQVAEAQALPQLTPETVEAFQNVPRTAELQSQWAQLIEQAEGALAQQKYQDALNSYRQVMPFQPDNPRVRAGMAWSLINLGKPMASRVWAVAMERPEAIQTLARTLQDKGDAAGSRALMERLDASRRGSP